ncbi:MAG: 6-phospho-3-hexuloisomerase [Erysipelotrichaceae bacterium]|jgi:6-phospho-3-hexuloisomerase|nr:6-phospho-3-hexuloisomerase [Erysipelotrichaceae bacterium]
MNYTKTLDAILGELKEVLKDIPQDKIEHFADILLHCEEIFCAGAGRSGFMVRGFAMRLMHLGFKSYLVGETVTPNIRKDGVLVICSGSGSTKSLVCHAQKAQEIGAKILLITIDPDSPIAKMAEEVLVIPAPSPKAAAQKQIQSVQPMGSLFEQSEGLLMDIIIMLLMEKTGRDATNMFARHANLE